MNFSRAFSYVFEDRDWLAKLMVTFMVTVGAALSVVLVGLPLWAALLGYQAELVRNVRVGVPQPMPRWTDFGGKIRNGANILIGVIAYNIPNALLGCCLMTLAPSLNSTFFGAGMTIGVACCVFPMLLIYNLIMMPMMALAIARYAEEGRANVFFEIGSLFALIQERSDATIQYLLAALLATIIFGLCAIIPCIGWVAVPALLVPVQGALMGQYAARVLGKPKAPPPAASRPPAPRPLPRR